MSDSLERTPPDRRQFLKLLGAAGVAAGLGTSTIALAQTEKSEAKKPPAAKPAPPAEEPPAISADAKSMMEVVKRRYGRHLNEEQAQEILEELNWRVSAGEALRKVPFANGDEPDFIFSA